MHTAVAGLKSALVALPVHPLVGKSSRANKGDVYEDRFSNSVWNGRRSPVLWTVEGECVVEEEYACRPGREE